MPGIFISYRHDGAAADAARISEALQRRCPGVSVFTDRDIPAGHDFRVVLAEKLDACDVLLVLIGKHWLEVAHEDTGVRRLDDEQDFVRFEIATALRGGKLVIPVLLSGAEMPTDDALPLPIQKLAWKQAVKIHYEYWEAGINASRHLPKSFKCECTREEEPVRKSWVYHSALPVLVLTATHVILVVSQFDPQLVLGGLVALLGFFHVRRFRFSVKERLITGMSILLGFMIMASIIVPLVVPQSTTQEASVLLMSYVVYAGWIFGGYLCGTLAADILASGKKFL